MRTATVLGATGLVGGRLLGLLAADKRYRTTFTLGRRAPEQADARFTHYGFDDNEAHHAFGTDVVFCCLGTTIRQAGSRAAFKSVDHDLVLEIARKASEAGTGSFMIVSSLGADPDAGNFYLSVKGETERALSQAGFERLGIVRPSLLLGPRQQLRPAEAIGQVAATLLRPLMIGTLRKYRAVDASAVAAALIELDQTEFSGVKFVESDALHRHRG